MKRDEESFSHFLRFNIIALFIVIAVFIPITILATSSKNIHIYNIPITTIIVCIFSLFLLVKSDFNFPRNKLGTLVSWLAPATYIALLSAIIFARIKSDPSVIIGAFSLAVIALLVTTYFTSAAILANAKHTKFIKIWEIIVFTFGGCAILITSALAFEVVHESVKSEFIALSTILVLLVLPMQFAKMIYEYF